MTFDIYDDATNTVRTYDGRHIDDALARYLDDLEAEIGGLSDHLDVKVREEGSGWTEYRVSHHLVREVTTDRGRRCDDPTKRAEGV